MGFEVSEDQNTITITEDICVDEFSFMAGGSCNQCGFKVESDACRNAPCVPVMRKDELKGCFIYKDYDDDE